MSQTEVSCQLIVDVRESHLMKALQQQGTPFTTASLDVGDFLIQRLDGDPLLVAERKSHADFAASNTDGRYREQRARLMAVRGSGVAVVYILEGIWTDDESRTYGHVSETTLKRLTTRLVLRYGLPVLSSATLADTARWCRTLLTQLSADPGVFKPDSDSATSAVTDAMISCTTSLNTVKKGNKTLNGTAMAMLSAVHGLGVKRAQVLLQKGSLAELSTMSVEELSKCLGPKVAELLYTSLHYHS